MRAQPRKSHFGSRLGFGAVLVCLILSLLGVRLWYLQVAQGAYYRDLSENNRTRTIRTVAPRGNIYDRDGRILVQNRPAFNVSLMLEDVPEMDKALKRLAEITSRQEQDLADLLKRGGRRYPFEPQVVMADVSRVDLARVKERNFDLPGVIVDILPARAYPHGDLAPHVFGYAREISKAQLDSQWAQNAKYRAGDTVGQAGIERQWDTYLHGSAGVRQVEVDAMGKRRGELGIVDDDPGQDVYLTLDLDLQRAAQDALGEEVGAVVALEPSTGEVLALASTPSFDANLFSGRIRSEDWKRLRNDKDHPLTNRPIAENYAPGSTFKLLMAVAGLAEHIITPETEFDCPGYYWFAGRAYRCHKRSGHGKVNLAKAVTQSCDSYFYKLGRLLGIDNIHKYATLFGLGAKTGIDLPGEQSGIAPSNEWKIRYLGERWYPGETLSVSIGQGFLTTTPIQMAVATAALANGGHVPTPRLLKKVVDRENGVVFRSSPQLRETHVDPKILEKVRGYAELVIEDQHGTGKRAAIDGITVAGKTGTAQVVSLGKETLKKEFNDHAWFVSFAPVENPMIAMAILVENGGHGGSTAAPISKKVMEVFFRKKGMLPEPESEEGAAAEAVTEAPAGEEQPAPAVEATHRSQNRGAVG
ncbi:MAG: penicillin-binding protein 2 [Bdellovibrionales bacterium]|nr:penicillin-binding protein 2 [Bdellovibrionales bacterium]